MQIAEQIAKTPPDSIVGQVRSFGPVGEKYEVLRPICESPTGDWLFAIRVLANGENAEYELSNILEDPEAK